MAEKELEHLCNYCYGTYKKCMELDKPPVITMIGDKVVECNMFFKKQGPGKCVNCESGGRIN